MFTTGYRSLDFYTSIFSMVDLVVYKLINYSRIALVLFLSLLIFHCVNGCGPGRRVYRQDLKHLPFQLDELKPHGIKEWSEKASGPIKGRIRRGSKRFKKELVRVVSTDILFKDDERTGADRYMTRRCKSMLQTLAQAVKIEWDGEVKLRVIEAWDENGEHERTSLHYEGRAIDVTTSDRDKSRYGKLAALAYYRAGFDFTAYVDAHVHVSCKADASDDTWANRCFPGDSIVTLDNGKTVAMENLKIGDFVLAQSSNGDLVSSEIIMFMDRKPYDIVPDFVAIETEMKQRLVLTRDHLIFAGYNAYELSSIFADDVQVGHWVQTLSSNNTMIILSKVTGRDYVKGVGAFAPLTADGTIIVNGVVTSCYAALSSHKLAHFSLGPWRLLARVLPPPMLMDLRARIEGIHWYPGSLKYMALLLGIL